VKHVIHLKNILRNNNNIYMNEVAILPLQAKQQLHIGAANLPPNVTVHVMSHDIHVCDCL